MDASFYFMFILLKKIVTFFIHTLRHRELMKHVEKLLPKKLSKLIHLDTQSHSAVSKVKVLKEFSHPMTTSMR
uniref:Secreted protein n=1 Tax=Caenorhabditis tropicalis TaxID=1561998 RepID=A0A1I7T0F3_9PELO